MLGWQTGPPRGMERLKDAEYKSKAEMKIIFKSNQNKDYQKGIENEPQEEVERDQEVETQKPELVPSTESLSNQIKPEEPKSLALYLGKAIKENKEWTTFDPKKWEEWINRNLPPSSEYDDYVKKTLK
ncbi:hypothetical protein O181_132266 [Austropuccinia psidii MF-1]|uniref:Uncharacterized protein n=1 Tax=Austropuccinia psidii MF-1 TaxID=1389203 RepID=A0A9Q3QB15_9BASI|nr:hypothetical protein [Austropuccinia psidii MF-1]